MSLYGSDNRAVTSDSESTLVVLTDATQIGYWSARFGATEAQLRHAVREVGRDAWIVQLYLNQR
jgi:hypothetical protein